MFWGTLPAARSPDLTDDLRARLDSSLGTTYSIQRELGGGMSRVFVATESSLNRPVVLKVLPPDLAQMLSTDRFRREIEVSARLQHPHIVPLLTAGVADGLLYYTMPLIEGESLRARLEKSGELPAEEARRLLRDVADALVYAHEHGVIHRDIKPDNVLVTAGHAVVTDFGVAKAMSESAGPAGEGGITSVGFAIGTPVYMAPEQGLADPGTDHRADIYAFGVMAYELLSGQPPFTGRSSASLIAAHAAEAPEQLERRRPELPAGLAALVMRCLAKRPADRPQSAREIVNALDSLSTPAGGTVQTAALPRGARRQRRWAGVAALALVAVAAWFFFGNRTDGTPVPEDISVIAVVPPSGAPGDTALGRIGRDLAMLLSANLDGQGNLRLSDPQTILAQVAGSSPTLAEAQALARKLHAGAVLYGGLVRTGGVVRADLTLYRADSSVVLATLSASAPPDSISALTDTLAWSLLRQIWRGRDAPTPNVAAVTTRSWPAMRAFLKGEAAFAAYRMQEAEDAYLAAVESDSTLWLAWHRLNYIRSAYLLRPADTAIRNRVEAHLDDLPDRERRMLEVPKMTRESVELDRRSSSRARYQAILRDYPDYWWGWWVLADNSYHTGGLIYGTSPEETIAELRRTVELNPSFVPAWAHLAQALYLRDSVEWAAAVAGGGNASPEAPWMGEANGWADPTVEALPDLTGMRAMLAGAPIPEFEPRPGYWMAAGAPQLATILLPEFVRDSRGERIHDDLQRARAWAWASRGAWDSALAVVGSIREGRPLDGYRLATIGGWIGGVPDDVVAAWKGQLDAVRASLSPRDRAEAEWLDGLDASAAGDSAGVSSAAIRVRKAGDPSGPLLARALGTFEPIRQGRFRPAADTLAQLEFDRRWLPSGEDGWQIPAAIPVHRLMAARALAASGDTVAALRQLNWIDGADLAARRVAIMGVLRAYALLERARLHEARGDSTLARYDYEHLLRRFDRPVASLAWIREEAQQGRGRMQGVAAPPGE